MISGNETTVTDRNLGVALKARVEVIRALREPRLGGLIDEVERPMALTASPIQCIANDNLTRMESRLKLLY